METLGSDGAPLSDSVDDPYVVELLANWDRLSSDDLERISAHPVHGPRLELLRSTDSWLEARTAGAQTDCPEPGDIYDFARGPGSTALEPLQRTRILDHLMVCGSCTRLVETLETSPPLPLDLGVEEPIVSQAERPALLQRRNPVLRWGGLLTAAAAVIVLGSVMFNEDSNEGIMPSYPLLRGEAAGLLHFPRGKVLASLPDSNRGYVDAPLFEVGQVEGATEYRVILLGHAGGAFEQGEVVWSANSTSNSLQFTRTLEPGYYTWEAFAMVDGLERLLGERDFQVMVDSDTAARMASVTGDWRVRMLHDAGYDSDARAEARKLPSSEARDAYLGQTPGR